MKQKDIFHALEAHVGRQEDVELMLLKGHLILEQCLNEFLRFYIPDGTDLERLNLTFARKLDLLHALGYRLPGATASDGAHIREINRIRNKLAHRLDFSDYHADLKRWACAVVGYTPATLNRRSTYLNTVKRAFYILTGYMWGMAETRIELKDEAKG